MLLFWRMSYTTNLSCVSSYWIKIVCIYECAVLFSCRVMDWKIVHCERKVTESIEK